MNKKAQAGHLATGIIIAIIGILLWVFLDFILVGRLIFGIGLIFLFFGLFQGK
jgi:hypothetical protein